MVSHSLDKVQNDIDTLEDIIEKLYNLESFYVKDCNGREVLDGDLYTEAVEKISSLKLWMRLGKRRL